MKLHEQLPPRTHLVGGYGAGGVTVAGRTYTRPLIIAPALLHTDWIADAAALSAEALAPLWPLEPRIVLAGGAGLAQDGLRQLRQWLATRQVALESMDLGAACRTYNVLAQEERSVAALLFPL